jgi:hypothetical protein
VQVKRLLEGDPRYVAVESSHEREELFNEYLASISDGVRRRQRMASAEERLKEREREVRRRREKEEREMDEQRSKVRLEEAVANFEALLSERIKHHDVPLFPPPLLLLRSSCSLAHARSFAFSCLSRRGGRASRRCRATDATRARCSPPSRRRSSSASISRS